MKLHGLSKALLLLLVVLFIAPIHAMSAEPSPEQMNTVLPQRLGSFQRAGLPALKDFAADNEFNLQTQYIGRKGERFTVVLSRLPQDGRAYELLSLTAQRLRTKEDVEINANFGTAGFNSNEFVAFFTGPYFVTVTPASPRQVSKEGAELAKELANILDHGEREIPVLLKHLPDWEQVQGTAVYLNRFTSLDSIATDPALTAIQSEGDADAAFARYGAMRLLIIEFNTPQRAAENDRRIVARIQELWKSGQPAPSAYRRIGNYAAFVFDAPDEAAAKQLIDQVHYEQVVSWLGENPNLFKEAERRYVNTTLGVLVAVLKASGFALIACFGTGAVLGTLLFFRRRTQQKQVEAYSDAGGMLRLNIDELTPQTDPSRLISRQ